MLKSPVRFVRFALHPLMAIALILVLTACTTPSDSASTQAAASPANVAETSASSEAAQTSVPGAENPKPNAQLAKLSGKATVVMKVNGQPITIEVDGTDAPITAGNFVDLVKRGVYSGTAFHRVEPGFVVQGGDPLSKLAQPTAPLGTGSFIDPKTNQPRYIPLEILPEGAKEPVYGKTLKSAEVTQPPKLKHGRGAVAMARSMLPDSASSQFYFALDNGSSAQLDGDYAVFGHVVSGMEIIDKIKVGDKIESATVTKGLENLKS
jgi:peptidyl-prolyl cis-trans isomerase B (cyclophilin B)